MTTTALRIVKTKSKKSAVLFYAKSEGRRVPAVWRRTEVSVIHGTVDGRTALCGDPTALLPHSPHDDDLSWHDAACNDCAELMFRVRVG